MSVTVRGVLLLLLLSGIAAALSYSTHESELAPAPLASSTTSHSILPLVPVKPLPVYSPEASDARGYKEVLTTLFWVGEESAPDNGFIANHDSYWDTSWEENFGGVDDPMCRDGFYPCEFIPTENPFYFALPYGEYDEGTRRLKASARQIPWYAASGNAPLLKNRWIEVVYDGKTCYGQWEDVGPFLTDDFYYVFGDSGPSNALGVGAGLDISPAFWECLELTTNSVTAWRFVSEEDVPEGPWKEIITTRR